MRNHIRLGINIDHVATLRNARGGDNPCPIRAALLALEAGANGITAHLREDRRHIKDHDIERLKAEVPLPLNLEMAATDEMLTIALRTKPHAVCLVPEKRAELTTEGGLDVIRMEKFLTPYIKKLQDNGSRVSLFLAPNKEQIEAAKRTSAKVVELHTGTYAENLSQENRQAIINSARHAHSLGLEVHAGHGLNYKNVADIAKIPEIMELNIGHFLIGEAVFIGLKEAIIQMRNIINEERSDL
jgi:pyridoxine 5-phosphate synthase